MSEKVTKELMHEILKSIQNDVSHIRTRADDLSEQFAGLSADVDTIHRARHSDA